MTDYIRAYYQAIKEGSIVVGKWILLLYEYIIKGRESKAFIFALMYVTLKTSSSFLGPKEVNNFHQLQCQRC